MIIGKHKEVITESDRLALIGLVSLGREAGKRIEECDSAIQAILGTDKQDSSDLLGDLYFRDDGRDVDECLRLMKISVRGSKKPRRK